MTIENLTVARTARIITLRAVVAAVLLVGCVQAHAADPNKVLRIASDDIDTLDPAQLQDYYSQQIASVIFEGLYEWDYLGNPPRPVPRTAAALPTYSADRKTWTIKVKPGIFFTDDPAFKRDVAKKYTMIVFPQTQGAFVVDLRGTYKAMAAGRKCLSEQTPS